jgi:hypothetical protein
MASLAMMNESGLTVYVVFRDADSQVWNDTLQALESYNASNWDDYAVDGSEQGATGYYYAGTPAALAAGLYRFDWRERAGLTPAVTDNVLASGSAYWNTANWMSLPWNTDWDAEVQSECADALTAAALTAAGIADAVWDEVLDTAHEVAGSSSVLVQAAGTAADPWLTALPGAYLVGTAGYLIGVNLATAGTTVNITTTTTTIESD